MKWFFALFLASWASFAQAAEKPVVVDGDNVRLGGVNHRLLGLDAPEVYSPQCEAEAARGFQAAGRLQYLINTRSVRLEPTGAIDKFRRPLARLYIGNEDAASILIREGLARPYTGGRRQPWCPKGAAREGAY